MLMLTVLLQRDVRNGPVSVVNHCWFNMDSSVSLGLNVDGFSKNTDAVNVKPTKAASSCDRGITPRVEENACILYNLLHIVDDAPKKGDTSANAKITVLQMSARWTSLCAIYNQSTTVKIEIYLFLVTAV